MQSISETEWDVVISGTGLQQSLLALALSRSNKNILHVDQNEYYGGAEAAFSLQEVEEWVEKVNSGNISKPFSNASFSKPPNNDEVIEGAEKLSFSRAYTLALSPQIIYSRSKLLSQLVSSKVYRQLEFQAVGNWWIYHVPLRTANSEGKINEDILRRVPNGREDVFSDDTIDVRSKRNLMKFLKFVVDFDNRKEVWELHAEESLPKFLSVVFNLPPLLSTTIMALTLSLKVPSQTTVQSSLPRIARHLTSMGMFGPGFAAVIPKWGGSSEIAQVACRAGAVGGGVYILGTGVTNAISTDGSETRAVLSNSDIVRFKTMVKSRESDSEIETDNLQSISKMIAIVSSELTSLFNSSVEGGPTAGVSVIAFPSNSIMVEERFEPNPVYIMAHSSETGECPVGQCVLYASSSNDGRWKARLESAITSLLDCFPMEPFENVTDTSSSHKKPRILYSVCYEQKQGPSVNTHEENICCLGCLPLDLAFNDSTLENVEDAWRNVMELSEGEGDTVSHADISGTYMRFEDREQIGEEEDFEGA